MGFEFWRNAWSVVVEYKDPLLLITGAAISAWFGVVTGRYFAYAAEVQRAREAIQELPRVFQRMQAQDSEHDAEELIVGFVLNPINALHAQGHLRASRALAIYSIEADRTLMGAWRTAKLEIKLWAAKMAMSGTLPNSPAAHQGVNAIAMKAVAPAKDHQTRGFTMLEELRPDTVSLFTCSRIGHAWQHHTDRLVEYMKGTGELK